MIVLDQENRIFTLHTKHTTYQIKADQYDVLLHTYYGPRIDGADLSSLIQCAGRSFSPNPSQAGTNRTYSLDIMPQEYSTCGVGDFRLPSIELELPSGSHTCDLRYCGVQKQKGKYTLNGLPAFFAGEAEAETLIVHLNDAAAQVMVSLYFGVFEHLDLITRAVKITNVGEQPVHLCRCASLCLDFLRCDMDFITFNGHHLMERCLDRGPLRSGVQSVGSVRGASSHQHNPFVMLCDHNADGDIGVCYGAMLLYSGNFEAAVECSQYENSRLVMGIHPYHFCWTLEPNGSFTAPEAAMVCSPNGFGQMSRQYHRAIREHLLRDPWAGQRKPVLVNNWEATYFNFNADKLAEIAKEAAPLGIELFVMDDGWFGRRNDDNAGLGDWYVNTEKLPGGLEALAPRIRELGMKFGIWMEPEMVNEDSQLYRQHPDWVLRVPCRTPARGRGQLVLDFSRKDVREHIYGQLKKVLSSADISYVKWDMNRSLTDVWSSALPAGRQGEVYHRYVLGVYDMLERLRQDFPQILIEGCCGGGGRFDGGMLYYTPQIWCSDDSDAIDRLRIQYGTSFCYPVSTMGAHVSAVPNEQNGRVTPLETRGTVAMCGAFGYEMDLSKCTEAEKQVIRQQIETYKARYALIHQGDYYRLASPFQNSGYTAWEQVSPDKREALVSVVLGCTHAAPPFRTLPLKGLDPKLNYQADGTGPLYSGAALMKAGWPLPQVPGDYQSFQFYFRAAR
ncbi:MAG: alpha-galactosidase [Oscillospiraceae bacterium]|nr:alpha-galactosidase [Oscillospiraceae bacterium]